MRKGKPAENQRKTASCSAGCSACCAAGCRRPRGSRASARTLQSAPSTSSVNRRRWVKRTSKGTVRSVLRLVMPKVLWRELEGGWSDVVDVCATSVLSTGQPSSSIGILSVRNHGLTGKPCGSKRNVRTLHRPTGNRYGLGRVWRPRNRNNRYTHTVVREWWEFVPVYVNAEKSMVRKTTQCYPISG